MAVGITSGKIRIRRRAGGSGTSGNGDGGKPALDLLEEAVHLLRRAPAGVLATYAVGTLPFALGLLYFWADMSQSAFACDRAAEASFSVALLFLWMKCWQAVFCAHLRSVATDAPPPRWGLRRGARLALVQASIQPWGLFARPLAAVITLPYVWVYATFQNVLVLGDGADAGAGARVREVFRRSAAQSRLWPGAHYLAQSILTLFGIFVWINVVVAMLMLPSLLKSLLGLETPFSRSPSSMLNSTFFATSFVATYLCVNPLTQAFYVLRCFYGDSLKTGEDLRVELAAFVRAARAGGSAALPAVAMTMLPLLGSVALLATPVSARAGAMPLPPLLFLSAASEAVPVASAPGVGAPAGAGAFDPARLDRTIEEVLNRREYAWRMPRERSPEPGERSWFARFLDGVGKTVESWVRPIKRWFGKLSDWLDSFARTRDRQPDEAAGAAWLHSLRWLLYLLTAAIAGVLAFLIWKRWKQGRAHAVAEVAPVSAAPDLAADEVTADQLPEDGWRRLAREMTDRGELRLALRALYLAGLAHLGARELVVLARHKSNRDYERDLRRRARTRGELIESFVDNVGAFERAWYGLHGVSRETLARFSANLERIRAC